jgi:hypothetical protein
MQIKIRQISFIITVFSYCVLVLFVVVGSINYVPKPGEDPHIVFHTISDIIDNNTTNTSIYLMFVCVYGVIKAALIAFSLLDIDVIRSELVEKRRNTSPRVRRFFLILSYVTVVFAAFQLFGMTVLVFFPISQVYHEHMVVAAFTFGSAFIKSCFFLIRRKLVYNVFSFFYFINILYIVLFFITALMFYFYRYGLIEYLLVFFILAENFLLVAEFFNLIFIFKFKIEDNDSADAETNTLLNNNLF